MPKSAPQRLSALEKAGLVTSKGSVAVPMKTQPKHAAKYTTHQHSGRTYYYATDAKKRTTKISGPLMCTTAKRKATRRVGNKRKADASGHLIAHSLGGPPTLTSNYVSMKASVNAAGGDWGRMESYIRLRLKQAGTAIWMAVVPHYPSQTMTRPDRIDVRLRFNKSPYRVRFSIPTP